MQKLKKIVIIGPESTGKSTLAQQLARQYHTVWCPEFAREYLYQNGKNYTYDDLLKIAMGQIDLEELLLADAHCFYFIDTDMYVMKVWCEVAFHKCHKWILNQIASRQYDLFLLCNIDLPWVYDELREYPELKKRQELYTMYRDLLINDGTKWAEISGNHNERFQTAVSVIDTIFPIKK
jgi:NadR type nicotinamide-nucleotide adenylyltransferase